MNAERVARTVHVGGLSAAVDEPVLAALFANCGTVTLLRLPPSGGASRMAWVEFAEPRRDSSPLGWHRRSARGSSRLVAAAAPPPR